MSCVRVVGVWNDGMGRPLLGAVVTIMPTPKPKAFERCQSLDVWVDPEGDPHSCRRDGGGLGRRQSHGSIPRASLRLSPVFDLIPARALRYGMMFKLGNNACIGVNMSAPAP